jgi:hypothetical protein
MLNWLTRRARRTNRTAPTTKRPGLRLESLEAREVPAVLIQLDYSYDTFGFFNNAEARATLERVAAELGNSLNANLAALVPSGGNQWTASFFNPATGGQVNLSNLAIGANTIRLFAGARDLPGGAAGVGGFGGYGITGSQSWINTVQTRGHAGFAPWGGSITFDTNLRWHFGATTAGLDSGELDFYSVAVHELGHVLGIGTANQWRNLISGGAFRGGNAMGVYGGAVPVTADGAHWADGVTVNGQAVSLDPSLTYGQRVNWTNLDAAALRDLGWGAVTATPTPEPTVPPLARVPLNNGTGTPVAFSGSADGALTLYTYSGGALVPTGQSFVPFVGYRGVLRVTGGDFNGDGVTDYVVTTGAGPQSVIEIFNGRDGSTLVGQTPIFQGFTGGLFISAGDIDGDGRADLAVSADGGAGPHVQTFRVVNGRLELQSSFFAFDDPGFRGGARVALGDLNRDGFADLVVTTGGLVEARVAIYSGQTLRHNNPTRLYADYIPFVGFRGAMNAVVGDMDGDGLGELVFSPDRGTVAHVKMWTGASLATGANPNGLEAASSFYAFTPADPSGARLAMRDMDGDGRTELVVASGNRNNAAARAFNFDQMMANGGGAPIVYPLGGPNSIDGLYAGLEVAQTANDTDDTAGAVATADDAEPTYTVSVAPRADKCSCGGCAALAQLAAGDTDDLFATVPVA